MGGGVFIKYVGLGTLYQLCFLIECVSLTIFYHLIFLRISKVWGILHHGSVGRVQSKECYFMFSSTFLAFLLLFFIKELVFKIFITFF